MSASPSCCGITLLFFLSVFNASAQTYPSKPVRVIVGFPAGAGVDTATRLVTAKLTESLGTQVIVDNRAGAAGNIAVELAGRAPPDGYTLGSVTAAATISQSAYTKPPFDLLKDFTAVAMVCSVPFVLGVHPSLPAKSLPEVLALARTKPGQLSYSTPGTGSSPHVAFELLKIIGKVDVLHVPYKGTPQAIMDTIAGNVSMALANTVTMMPPVKSGRLRAIAITTAKRSNLVPDLPTFAESGVPGYQSGTWYAIMAPAATPREIVARLNEGIVRAVQQSDVREKLHSLGTDPMTYTPSQTHEFVRGEAERMAKVVKVAGIRLD